MMSEPTGGSWKAVAVREADFLRWRICVDDLTPWVIAVVENGAPDDTLDTEEANAHLLAASKDLLEALKSALPYLRLADQDTDEGWIALGEAEDAIAKAEGESP